MTNPAPEIDSYRSLSFWQESVGLPAAPAAPAGPQTPAAELLETDLCVVGGGVIGSAAALFARQAGLDVLLLDARQPALGASGRNAGMVLSGIAENYAQAVDRYGRATARALWQLSIDNRGQMISLARQLGVPVDVCGSRLLADCPEEAALLAESARLLAEDGFPHEFSPTDPTGRGFLACLHRPDDAVLNPAHFCQALNAHSRARVIRGARVTGLEPAPGGVLVTSQPVRVSARRVLLATNGYSAGLHPFFVGKVRPCRGQIQLSEPAPLVFAQAGYSHFGYYYFRQVPEPDAPGLGRWLMGGARHLHFETENDHLRDDTTGPVQAALRAYTARYFPELADVPVAQRWAGTMGFTPDGLPLVGELPDLPGAFFCVGFNGHGMGLGVKVVERALDLMLHGRSAGAFAAARLMA